MLPSLKTAFTLLSLIQLVSSRPMAPSPQKILKEVILLIQQLNSGVQVNAATPLSFALLSDLVIDDDDDDDDDDVLQCPRPATGLPQGLVPIWVPCNDTRVAQVAFMDKEVPDQELLCQADVALTKVTRCREIYEPLVVNLKRLHGKKNCFLSDESEIYLRHFLPALGNFTQGMYRRRGSWAAQ
ncbi:hypothetical protein DV515_00006963 [Chloebia gouldiae]|uniref:Uncharacterized protein n=1 Tax=Chloebia gouldiae TaxID=44316 RepID=A0A3L8SJL2_CHLGU|nr:hypothetical protein DV515_00006963 [Chloebia gouldiae]